MSDRYQSRYAAESPGRDESRSQVWAEVNEAMTRLFGPPRNADGFAGGVILRVSNGTPPDPEVVNCDGPGMSEAWRKRIEKARKDAAEHTWHIDWQETVDRVHESITVDDISELKQFCEGLFE